MCVVLCLRLWKLGRDEVRIGCNLAGNCETTCDSTLVKPNGDIERSVHFKTWVK